MTNFYEEDPDDIDQMLNSLSKLVRHKGVI